jgi:hypothetical protein
MIPEKVHRKGAQDKPTNSPCATRPRVCRMMKEAHKQATTFANASALLRSSVVSSERLGTSLSGELVTQCQLHREYDTAAYRLHHPVDYLSDVCTMGEGVNSFGRS